MWLFEESNVQHVLSTYERLLPLFILGPQCDQADLLQGLADSSIVYMRKSKL